MKKRKKVARKKSEKRVRGSDESEGSSGEAAPKRKAGGGFQKPFNLSPQLAEVCGETQVGPLVSSYRHPCAGDTRQELCCCCCRRACC